MEIKEGDRRIILIDGEYVGSDSRIMQEAAQILDEYKIKHEDQIVSAHRTPARLEE